MWQSYLIIEQNKLKAPVGNYFVISWLSLTLIASLPLGTDYIIQASIDPWPKFRICSFVPLVRYLLGLAPQTRLRPAQSAGITALPLRKISSFHLCPEIAFLQILRVSLYQFAFPSYFGPDRYFLRILILSGDEPAGQTRRKILGEIFQNGSEFCL